MNFISIKHFNPILYKCTESIILMMYSMCRINYITSYIINIEFNLFNLKISIIYTSFMLIEKINKSLIEVE